MSKHSCRIVSGILVLAFFTSGLSLAHEDVRGQATSTINGSPTVLSSAAITDAKLDMDGVNVKTVTSNSGTVKYFSNGTRHVEACHVRTAGGNLNVRNNRNKIIGQLPNGTEVNVINYFEESTWVEITAYVGGKFIRGFVEGSYIDCHQSGQ